MTPIQPTIPTPIEAVRDLFEIPEGITYLNCASSAPACSISSVPALRSPYLLKSV
jgi:hypothetical protein